jgi:hypothetical protein
MSVKEVGGDNRLKDRTAAKILDGLSNAQSIFKQYKQDLCEARVILIKAKFHRDFHKQHGLSITNCEQDLKMAVTIFSKHNCLQHKSTCLMYLALIESKN